ncbi:diadenylate cyclase [Methanosphaerula subterraneus]|uniref:diadenylate cyclase n=1 Tax=Methanosphaerula subterraneus TaxID=3350244 RepID=UPI003F824843
MAIPSLASAEPLLPNETTQTVVPSTPTTLPTVIPPDTTVTPDTTQIQTVTPTPTSIPTVVTTVTTFTTIPTTPVTTLPVTTIATTPITTLPVTTIPTIVTQPTTTITSSSHTPPSLLINPPTINQLKITVDGTSTPGEFGQTITRISWNWGDGRIEDQQFPASHTYARAGRYVVTATSYQSDGTFNTRNFEAELSPPSVTTTVITTTMPLPGAPRLVLMTPEINNSTVVVNGIPQVGSPSMSIVKLQVDWGDQKKEDYAAFPFQHTYTSPGQYQIWVTGVQSDGQSTIQNLTVEIGSLAPGTLPTPVTSIPGPFWTRSGVIPGLLVVLIAAIVGGGALLWRRRDMGSVVIPTSEPLEEAVAAYTRAREHGDLVQARKNALECAQLLVILAEAEPQYSAAYLEKADDWKAIARSLTQHLETEHEHEQIDQSPVISLEKNGSRGTAEKGEEVTLDQMSTEVLEGTDIDPTVFGAVLTIALEIAREGREGQAVGTAFIVGDSEEVMNASTQFILNPFKGHQIEERLITDQNLHENIKEFALLDGAFIISSNGAVEAAGRYITVDTSGVSLPAGLGSRHASAAGITRVTNSVGVVVSQSGGLIKVIKGGKILWTITP